MGLFDKVKNFFYDEEYEEEEIKPVHKEKKEKIIKKKIEETDSKNDVSEMELFKAERTFNFPMDIEDEYTVSLICDYETQVVAPIVKVDGLDELPSLAEGESFTFAFT